MTGYRVIEFRGKDLPAEYRGLVYSKWLRSLRYGNDFFRLIDAKAYFTTYNTLITAILANPETVVRLAVLADDHDVVLGFASCRGTTLDYVHVHAHQRRQGIGSVLVPIGIETITHLTKTGLTIWGTKYGTLKFNPFV